MVRLLSYLLCETNCAPGSATLCLLDPVFPSSRRHCCCSNRSFREAKAVLVDLQLELSKQASSVE